jgi:GDP-L-fucose synthase
MPLDASAPKTLYELRGKRVWVAGHNGLAGGAIIDRLEQEDCEVVIAPREQIDLRNQDRVQRWVNTVRPQAVFMAAARVGGIYANSASPVEFLRDNILIETNVIDACHKAGVEKLLFLGSSCIYPKHAPQPMREDCLLEGQLEPTNQWYATAKIAGIKLCQAYRQQYGCDFISAMPTNLYGPRDNFDIRSGHVIGALMAKAHEARASRAPELPVWGTGQPRREFLYVADAADAFVHIMKHYSDDVHINVGTGNDVTIAELARLVCDTVGFNGTLTFDTTMPDGTPQKLLDVSRLKALGWQAKTPLPVGLKYAYKWFQGSIARRAVAFC